MSERGQWIPAIRIESGATEPQRRRNFEMYQRLQTGLPTFYFSGSRPSDEDLQRLLRWICECMPASCDADEMLAARDATIAGLRADAAINSDNIVRFLALAEQAETDLFQAKDSERRAVNALDILRAEVERLRAYGDERDELYRHEMERRDQAEAALAAAVEVVRKARPIIDAETAPGWHREAGAFLAKHGGGR